MKPKYRRFVRNAFPALIVVPAMAQLASAGTIVPDTPGNILVPGNYNGGAPAADTILASGGTTPNFEVDIQAGAIITGDAALFHGIIVSSPNYTIFNDGTVNTTNGVGINATQDFILQNNGRIEANGNNEGISGIGGGTVITNFGTGTITGDDDAIYFGGNGGTVFNYGLIEGTDSSFGINAFSDVGITNFEGGTITGDSGGIDVGSGLGLQNSGTISSANGVGVDAGASAIILNETTFDLFGNVTGGGLITGANAAIDVGSGASITNELAAEIGGSVNGIVTDTDASISNSGGTISGGTGSGIVLGAGISADDRAVIDNNYAFGPSGAFYEGLISGANGITTAGNATINNSGIIRGLDGSGIFVEAGSPGVTVNNTGEISGTVAAFYGDAGNDILNLTRTAGLPFAGYEGSQVFGDVIGLGGTDSINFSGGLTAPGGPSNVIHGDVEGFETISKSGGGVAFIGDVGDSVDVEVDTIGITGGGLYINGDIFANSAPLTTINAGGAALGGTGLWEANINVTAGGFSAGDIPINLDANPENAVGFVTVDGNVDHSPNSFIRFDVIPDTAIIDGVNSDLIIQTGALSTYDVDGAFLRVSTTDMDRTITPGVYTVVDSEGSVTGSLAGLGVQVNLSIPDTGYQSTAWQALVAQNAVDPAVTTLNVTNTVFTRYFAVGVATGSEVLLSVDYDFAGLPGLSDNQSSLGNALDNLVGSPDPDAQDLVMALALSDLDSVSESLNEILAPIESAMAYSSAVINSNYRLHRQAQDHLAVARASGETVTHFTPASRDAKGGVVAQQTSTEIVGGKGNVWGSFSYDWQDYEGQANAADFDGETGAFTAGFDYRVAPNLIVGILLDGSKAEYDDGPDIESFRGALYGTWGASTGLYVDVLVGYGDHDLDVADAQSLQALGTVGYAIGDERVKHGPFAGLEYQKLDADGFDVSDGVEVDDFDVDSLRGLLGYRVNTNFGRFRPYASVAYAHEFKDDGETAGASIYGAGFRVRGAEQGSAVLLTAGTGISLSNSLTLDVGYRGELSTESEGIDSHGGSLGLNFKF